MLYLNAKNEPLMVKRICKGKFAATGFDMRTAIEYALKTNANRIVIAHNHTSGDPTPSKNDKEATKMLVTVLKFLDIHLKDHIILGECNTYFSFQEAGLLD